MRNARWLALLSLSMLAVAGCGPRLDDEKSVDMQPDKIQQYSTPSPIKDLTVTFQSDKEPISVYVVDSSNDVRDVENLTNGKPPNSALGKQEKAKSGEIKVNVPNKKHMTVLVVCEKSTHVKVKLTGR